jgi:glycosyltransferase involved in cell wall biosynthesis
MKILIINPWIRLGGAELICVSLANELKRVGHEVRIATLYVDLENMPVSASKEAFVLPPRPISQICRKSRVAFYLIGPIALLTLVLVTARKYQILNPHNYPAHWIAAITKMLTGIPVLWTCNEPPERIPFHDIRTVGIFDYLGWLIASSPIDRALARKASHIQVLSRRVQTQITERYKRDSTVIRLGVEAVTYDPDRSSFRYQSALDGKFNLIVVGRLHPQKNQRICLHSLKAVLPSIPNAQLLVVGEGPMQQSLVRLAYDLEIGEHVRFLGSVSANELGALYDGSQANLLAAVNQSWGLTPFEALSVGLISIVSSSSGAAEVIAEHGIGIVAEPNPAAFAKKIIDVHAYPERHRKMAAKGREYLANYMTHAAHAKRILGLFEQLVEPAGGLKAANTTSVIAGERQ